MSLARRHQNSGRVRPGTRSASHRAWVRGHRCVVENADCAGKIECAHVEGSGTGGMGFKAADIFTISLCHGHHAERHRIGWRTFDTIHHLDALSLAKDLARRSPHVQRAAREAGVRDIDIQDATGDEA